MDTIEKLDEIEDLIRWNLSFEITIEDTLTQINRLDLLDFFTICF